MSNAKAAQLYIPDLLEATSTFNRFRARVDLLADTADGALVLADLLTARLAPDARNPHLNNRPRTESRVGPTYGLVRVTFEFLKSLKEEP